MLLSLAACGNASVSSPSSGSGSSSEVTVTFFNTKPEINSAMEQMAREYSNSHNGVTIEVCTSDDTVADHMAARYAARDPYTIAMVDTKDIYTLGPEHAFDLTGQPYIADATGCIELVDRIASVPFCVEARGLIYNASAIETILGREFVPSEYATLDAFRALLDELVVGGMTAPVGILKEDWSLAAHYLAQFIEERDDPDALVADLRTGRVDLIRDAKFNSLMDTFDVLKTNNYAASSPLAAEREATEQRLAEGKIAFMFGGNWDWAQMSAYDCSEKIGMMPLPINTTDIANTKLIGGPSKMLFVEASSDISVESRQAALEFLIWLFSDGSKWLTEEFALVPAISTISADSLDPLSRTVSEYSNAGKLIPSYNYMPDDHITRMGAEMQKYLVNQCSREELASAIEAYWTTVP